MTPSPLPFDLQPTLRGELLEPRPLRPEDFDVLFEALDSRGALDFGHDLAAGVVEIGRWRRSARSGRRSSMMCGVRRGDSPLPRL